MIKSFSDPYPHLIIDSFISTKTCEKIIQEIKKNNNKFFSETVMGGRKRFHLDNFNENEESYQFNKKLNKNLIFF